MTVVVYSHDFEDSSTLNGWFVVTPPANSSAQAHGGTKSVLVTCDGSDAGEGARPDDQAVEAAVQHTFSCWVYPVGTAKNIRWRVQQFIGVTWNEEQVQSPASRAADTWTQVSYTITLEPGTDTVRPIIETTDMTSATFYTDDWLITNDVTYKKSGYANAGGT